MTVGEAIRTIRLAKRIRQQELARRVGCKQGYISQIERNSREPSLQLFRDIANALGVPPYVLLALATETRREVEDGERRTAVAR
jgi:transcriptional regulator with XRE-family HTH domain